MVSSKKRKRKSAVQRHRSFIESGDQSGEILTQKLKIKKQCEYKHVNDCFLWIQFIKSGDSQFVQGGFFKK
jgi:hypothetical protein